MRTQRGAVIAIVVGALLAAGACSGQRDPEQRAADPAASAAADRPGGEPGAGPGQPTGSPGAEPGAQIPPMSAEELTGGQETTDLPEQWPAEVPLPAGAAILEAAQPPGAGETAFYLYLRVAGELEPTVRALAGHFDDAGFGTPEVELAEATGRLQTSGHGRRISVEARVSPDNQAVVDLTYHVSAVS